MKLSPILLNTWIIRYKDNNNSSRIHNLGVQFISILDILAFKCALVQPLPSSSWIINFVGPIDIKSNHRPVQEAGDTLQFDFGLLSSQVKTEISCGAQLEFLIR